MGESTTKCKENIKFCLLKSSFTCNADFSIFFPKVFSENQKWTFLMSNFQKGRDSGRKNLIVTA